MSAGTKAALAAGTALTSLTLCMAMLGAVGTGPGTGLMPGGFPAFEASAGGTGTAIAAAALRWVGTPYSWGGGSVDGPTEGFGRGAGTIGFDCSGLVVHAVHHGTGGRITPPRVAAAQVAAGQPVALAQILPGDVIGIDHHDGQGISHIVVYIGREQVVHAPHTGEVVRIAPLSAFQGSTWHIRRYR